MRIIPAILEHDIEEFENTFKKLRPHYSHFQIDISDGEYVPKKTIQIDDLVKFFSSLKHSKSLPSPLVLDFDLMVKDPVGYIEQLETIEEFAKIDAIFVRPALVKNYKKLANLYPEIKIGFAIDPIENIDTIAEVFDLDIVPAIQIMTVKPGAQGNPFLEDMLTKIEQLKMDDYRSEVYLDGSINNKTLKKIMDRKYQPDVLCIGGYLTKVDGDELQDRINWLLNLNP